ncbi:hypothetical protein TELCIR_03357 [Teladorsagia circumcincta]|uniref:Uncharacterized protein n=1 Tax=Teladorsagia circumcincta TaxID=45464 RepID=A0A2G9UY28_TELCI|nr:hypothetical protein TELCIR_03357 [Teladorsagia circumcincta]
MLPPLGRGWDFDENAAPGAIPQDYFLQTTFIHRSENKQQKDFAELVLTKLGVIRERLRQMARITVDNEVISCVEDSEHYRCGDFQRDSSYHYFVVEDSNGDNIGSTYYLRDEKYYLQWMYLMVSGPVIELGNDDSVKKAKKGLIFGSEPHPVTIGTFPDRDCSEYQHFKLAADRLQGRYFMAVIIKPGSSGTVTTYRPTEKQRRRDYDGRLIFHEDSRRIFSSDNRLQVHKLPLESSTTSDQIWEWIQTRDDAEGVMSIVDELSVREPHPLRLLQKAHVDAVFGVQNTMILPDETLYQEIVTHANKAPHSTGGAVSGGCPFMMGGGAGGGGALHEEL